MEVQFDDLDKSDFFIDSIYRGGYVPNISSEPFHKLIPGVKTRVDLERNYAKMLLVSMHMWFYILPWKSLSGNII